MTYRGTFLFHVRNLKRDLEEGRLFLTFIIEIEEDICERFQQNQDETQARNITGKSLNYIS